MEDYHDENGMLCLGYICFGLIFVVTPVERALGTVNQLRILEVLGSFSITFLSSQRSFNYIAQAGIR
jgi:hypothetical protein